MDTKGNKKDICKYNNDKRKTKQNVGSLLNEMGDLVTQDRKKVDILNTFFTSILTSKTSLQES